MKLLNTYLFVFFVLVGQIALAFEPLKTEAIFPTTPIRQDYIGEDSPGSPQALKKGVDRILYFHNPNDREQFRVFIRNGIVFKLNEQVYEMAESKINYVMDAAGNFYFFENEKNKAIRHSSILAGGPVAAAGEMVLGNHGNIKSINRASGHYKPAAKFFQNALDQLAVAGVNFNETEILE